MFASRTIQADNFRSPEIYAEAPLKRIASTYRDVEQLAGSTDGWLIRAQQIGAGRFEASSKTLVIGQLHITEEYVNLAVSQDTVSPQNRTSLIFPLESECGWRVNGQQHQGQVVALRQGETELFVTPGNRSRLLHVEMPFDRFSPSDDDIAIAPASTADEALRDWLLSLLHNPSDGLDIATEDVAMLEFLLTMKLEECSSRVRQQRRGLLSHGEHFDLLRRLETTIIEEDLFTVPLHHLRKRAGLSASELTSITKGVYGVDSDRWFKLLRLNGVRRHLCAGWHRNVTDAATTWGFFHLGRFSVDYSAHFGETPRATLRGIGVR